MRLTFLPLSTVLEDVQLWQPGMFLKTSMTGKMSEATALWKTFNKILEMSAMRNSFPLGNITVIKELKDLEI